MSSCSLVDVTLSGNFVCWIRGPLWSDRCPFCLLMSFVFVCVCVFVSIHFSILSSAFFVDLEKWKSDGWLNMFSFIYTSREAIIQMGWTWLFWAIHPQKFRRGHDAISARASTLGALCPLQAAKSATKVLNGRRSTLRAMDPCRCGVVGGKPRVESVELLEFARIVVSSFSEACIKVNSVDTPRHHLGWSARWSRSVIKTVKFKEVPTCG